MIELGYVALPPDPDLTADHGLSLVAQTARARPDPRVHVQTHACTSRPTLVGPDTTGTSRNCRLYQPRHHASAGNPRQLASEVRYPTGHLHTV